MRIGFCDNALQAFTAAFTPANRIPGEDTVPGPGVGQKGRTQAISFQSGCKIPSDQFNNSPGSNLAYLKMQITKQACGQQQHRHCPANIIRRPVPPVRCLQVPPIAETQPVTQQQRNCQKSRENHAVTPQYQTPPVGLVCPQPRHDLFLDGVCHLFQRPGNTISAIHIHTLDTLVNLGQIMVALALVACSPGLIFNRHRDIRIIDTVKPPCRQSFLCHGPLPCTDNRFRIILPRRGIHLVQDVDKLGCIRPVDGRAHQMRQSIAHGARFRVACIKKHQHQIRQVDDMI